ncbi:hypothetical protein [Streptomyces sp. WMMC940]|uniref:hypothetical protein n=1 Tax=Streptomyces sp. WMMC940 TaxID=3015153 RepID=UPI0022B750EF|nr:hypothetical protein [Streptomyces sp. WMMC940]MCZ7456742.1 hypothetical protein [Streptomyces sp. WMMC940]
MPRSPTEGLRGEREKAVRQIAGMSGVPRPTVQGHLDRTGTVPRRPKKAVVT